MNKESFIVSLNLLGFLHDGGIPPNHYYVKKGYHKIGLSLMWAGEAYIVAEGRKPVRFPYAEVLHMVQGWHND